ncbi:MAG: PfkB family carbohydrate kinase [Elusimicrobia bacterium]|nr:PfkB family carbohydrate kinase [Elusimicrobiota bacterium]
MPETLAKIKTLAQLSPILRRLREQGKRIVHCHGVFDLMHLGHIRHFQQAKKLGDVLVVTLTQDRWVNRGPGRPVFTQEHRAEAIAALNCVNFVAINDTPLAVGAIQLLRPHFYVKGPDYKDAGKDLTGGIRREREAVEAVGGKLVITDDLTFSSSSLINRHLGGLPPKTMDFLARFHKRHPLDEVLGYLRGASKLRFLFVGEAIIDEYRYCVAIGKSSKEPMLAIKHLETERFAGGIVAAANNAASILKQADVVTLLGDREPHEAFFRDRCCENVRLRCLPKTDSPTIVKRRYIDRYFFTKLLAIYEMNDTPLIVPDNRRLCGLLRKLVPQYDGVVVLDFGHGMLSDEAIEILCSKAKFLAVNTQSNAGNLGYHAASRYRRADFLCMAENEFRLEERDLHSNIRDIVRAVAKKLHCPSAILTGGKFGCLTYSARHGYTEVPAVAHDVVDRMGAGDTFFAVTAPCVAQGAPMDVVGFIGNVAGAEAVATVGHRTFLQRTPLFKHIETLLK